MAARIRRAMPGDEAALALVGAATFLETYAHMLTVADIASHCAVKHSAAHYAAWLADARWALWLAETETGAPVGYAAMGPRESPIADESERDAELHRIYVLTRFQGLGVGAGLMDAACEAASAQGKRRIVLGVNKTNAPALAFYAKAGFSRAGERKFRVGAIDHDDFVLARSLEPGLS